MIDQLRQVAIFAKTIDHGSFRGAAKELGLSPSVVSHHISQLEEQLGVSLIYRSTRKLALTQEGEQLLASTQSMFETVETALSELSSSASKPAGELRLSTPSILIKSSLTDRLAEFSIKYPDVKLILDYSDERRDLIAGGYDIAIRMGKKHKGSTKKRSLFSIQRRLVAARSYLKNRPKFKTPQDLLTCNWIELSPVRHIKPNFINSSTKQMSIKPAAHISTNDALAVYQLACSGAGLAIVPEFFTEDSEAAGVIDYVLPEWKLSPIEVFAEWPSNAPKHGLVNLLIEELSPSRSLR